MRLGDLVDVPALKLRVVLGGRAELDRPVHRVYTTDLLEPGRYLTGGELVLSGLVWRSRPEDSETFVAAITGAGASALAAGDARFGGIPADLVQACRRHRLPLLEVPVDVSFGAVTDHVTDAAAADRGARLALSLTRQQQLLAAVAGGRGLDDVAALVSAETGITCRVLTPSGRHVVAGPAPLTGPDTDRVTATFLAADRLPATTRERDHSVFPVGPALGHRMTSWFVVADSDVAGWPVDAVESVGELAAIAAVERSRREEGVRALRRIAEDVCTRVVDGVAGSAETSVRLGQAGVPTDTALAVVLAGFCDRPDLVGAARSVLEDAAAQLGPAAVGTGDTAEGTALALVPAADTGYVDVLGGALGRLAPGVGRTRLVVGVSEATELAALGGALEEARYAQRLAALRPGRVSVARGAEVTSHVLLLAAVPDEARHTFAERVLGPVLRYDAEHGGGLRPTLEAFLDCDGSWSRAAASLHVHVNTVRYRVSRVEELTGRTLSRLEDRVDFFLALRSLAPRHGPAVPPPP